MKSIQYVRKSTIFSTKKREKRVIRTLKIQSISSTIFTFDLFYKIIFSDWQLFGTLKNVSIQSFNFRFKLWDLVGNIWVWVIFVKLLKFEIKLSDSLINSFLFCLLKFINLFVNILFLNIYSCFIALVHCNIQK